MERDTSKHVEEERLEAYAMHLVAGDELASVEEHLLFCETCQDQLQAVEGYVQAMRSAAMRVIQEEIEAPGAFSWPPTCLVWVGSDGRPVPDSDLAVTSTSGSAGKCRVTGCSRGVHRNSAVRTRLAPAAG